MSIFYVCQKTISAHDYRSCVDRVLADYRHSKEHLYTASVVATIDSIPVEAYLQNSAANGAVHHDPDAAYNEQFFSIPAETMRREPRGKIYEHEHLSDTTVVMLSNGTKVLIDNVARIMGNFSGIKNGQDVQNLFEIPDKNGLTERDPRNLTLTEMLEQTFIPKLNGYPKPFTAHLTNYIHGHHFKTSSLKDVAVLVINSFVNTSPLSIPGNPVLNDTTDFVRVVREFVQVSRASEKKRLILDFQANAGGWLPSVVYLHTNLFPGRKAWLGSRIRTLPIIAWLGRVFAKLRLEGGHFPYVTDTIVDGNLQNFSSWDALFESQTIRGDNFSQIYLPQVFRDANEYTTYSRLDPWFQPTDTVILTDGNCHSACAAAVGMLSRDLGIQVIAMGGRRRTGPMQSIGGTKGGGLGNWGDISSIYNRVQEKIQGEPIPEGLNLSQYSVRFPPIGGNSYNLHTINTQSQHQAKDPSGIPVQFLYEAAHCRLFYTWDTLTNMEKLWEVIAEVKWGNGACVDKSTTDESNIMGTVAPAYSPEVRSNYSWIPGPGDL
jgi:hypothetical protein